MLYLSSAALPQQAGLAVPQFQDVRETMPKPDVAGLSRLRFLTTTDFRPFNFLDSQGRLTGFHVDLARAICAELGLIDRCEIQALPWAELEPALRKGDGEALLAGIAVSAETRRRLGFTRVYLRFPARFVAPRASDLAEPLAVAIEDRRIGVIAGTAHERLLRERFGALAVQTFDDQEAMLDALADGRLDAAFGDGLRLATWLGTSQGSECCKFVGGPYMAPDYLGQGMAVAVKPEDANLRAAIDWSLQRIAANGTFAELYLRYFPIGFF
jgi:polar amino acid transport system substrate-binding protein